MKIIGKNSLIYWLKLPYLIYVIGFSLASIWIMGLMIYFLFTKEFNSYITSNKFQYDGELVNTVEFRYPFSKMVLQSENSYESVVLALLGISSLVFILIQVYKIVNKLSKEMVFTKEIVSNFKTFSYGLIFFGLTILVTDITMGATRIDITPPFFYVLIGVLFLFIKEIFLKGTLLQEQTDLTI